MIAIVYPQFYGVGGIARYLDSFLKSLPEQMQTVYLITGDEHRVSRHYPNVELIHIPFNSSRMQLFFWMLKVRRVLKQLYHAKKIHSINLHIPPLIPGLMLPNEIPLVLTAHTTYLGMSGQFYDTKFFNCQWSQSEVWIKMLMEHFIFRRAKKIICLTEQGKEELLQYGIKRPIEVIPNGVDLETFSSEDVGNVTYDVLFSGRIEHRKGSRSMVEVCKKLIQTKSDIRILIVGYGDDDATVKAELGKFSQVTLTGKVSFDAMKAYYLNSRIYVSTSYYEGLPGTCLEAMAMGLPAVVWDFLFYRELVVPFRTGLLIPVNDCEAMVQSILDCLQSRYEHLNNKDMIRQHIKLNYDWRKLAPRLITQMS